MSQEVREHDGKKTERGFHEYAEFADAYGCCVRVRESSSAEAAHVWIFCDKGGKDCVFHLGEWSAYSPHLNLAQATKLRDALSRFIADATKEEAR